MSLSLRTRLLGVSLISAVLIVTFLVLETNSVMRDRMLVNLLRDVQHFAGAYGEGVGQWMTDRQRAMTALKGAIERNSSVDKYTLIRQAHESGGFALTYYGNAQGEMFRQDPALDQNNGSYDPRQRGWYKQAQAEDSAIITKPYVSKTLQALVVTLAEPVRENGKMVGSVGANVTLNQLTKQVQELDVPGNGYAILVDLSDQIIAHPEAELQTKSVAELSPRFSKDGLAEMINQDRLFDATLDEAERFVYAKAIPNTNWALIFVMDKKALLAPVNALLIKQSVIGMLLIIVLALVLVFFFKVMFKNLEKVSRALADIAEGEGDLTVRIAVDSRDEIGVLADGFNRFVERLHGIVSRLNNTSISLAQSADQFAASAHKRSERIQEQQDEINMVATAITQMAMATQEIAGNAEMAAVSAQESVALSSGGQKQVETSQQSIATLASEVESATSVIGDLEKHAEHISGILNTISGIAEQTNLLALNAAIEAARAGDQGRGFAVVADEVRVLSQRTHASTGEIQTMIDTLQKTTQLAVKTMSRGQEMAQKSVHDADEAHQSLEQIITAISNISDKSTQIASAAEEQTSVTEEINRNTSAISDVATDMAREGEQAAKQASELRELIRQVESEVKRFSL
ncbi:methyl-accepting chemotaxis protein [Neptunomonas phycophila]|uniref:methyl-accepting chemotaxis protein n=1 Tax=Neptunomonas phycophila TaxID=1572645 RepID=UPI000948BB8E|nr:methyl-accepting chemotaxis protein [Neptunomonas phycophila]